VTPSSADFAPIEDAIAAIGRGEIVVVIDDEDRENEGDLIMGAEFATEEAIGFFVRYTSGVICAPMTNQRADELDLPLMVANNTEVMRTAFTTTVDYRWGTTTGISAQERALTIAKMVDADTKPGDLARPGHILPLRAREGGVLRRAGHTEAAVDLARLAGLAPAGVLCEIVNPDGTMARLGDLVPFCREHNLLLITIADLIRYRRRHEKLVEEVGFTSLETPWGQFGCRIYESTLENNPDQHLALVLGDVAGAQDVLIRMHSERPTDGLFAFRPGDDTIHPPHALARIAEEGAGVLVYLRGYEGRRLDTEDPVERSGPAPRVEIGSPRDSRRYGVGAQILVDLGLSTVRLLTNSDVRVGGFAGYGLEVTERVKLDVSDLPPPLR